MSTNFPFLNLDTTLNKDSTPGKKITFINKLRGSKQMFLLPSSSLRELPNDLGLTRSLWVPGLTHTIRSKHF